ncbi:AzlD domain-containing protein [Pseudostreptobacillus sp.]
MKLWLTVIVVGILTQTFRLVGNFIPIPRNRFMDKFLESIPISILVILFFPDIFVSIGTKHYEIILAIFASLSIIFMTLKKIDLGKIMMYVVIAVIILNMLLSKIFS